LEKLKNPHKPAENHPSRLFSYSKYIEVALLLALVMVLSLLPMNVFGNPRGTVTGIRTNTDEANFTVNVDAVDFRNRATTPVGLFIEFTVTDAEFPNSQFNLQNADNYPAGTAASDWRTDATYGADRIDAVTWAHTAGGALNPEFADWLNEGVLTRWSATRLTLELPDPPVTISDDAVLDNFLAGIFSREVRVNPSNNNARLTVTLNGVDSWGRPTTLVTLAQADLVRDTEAGVTITAGASVPLVGAAKLNNISIRENSPGALAPVSVSGAAPVERMIPIRLVAPLGFVWALGNDMTALGGNDFNVGSANAALLAPTFRPVITQVPDTNGRDTIIVAVTMQRNPALLAQNETAQINLENLWLVATAGAPRSGNANIEVALGYFASSIVHGGGPGVDGPNFTGMRWAFNSGMNGTEDFMARHAASASDIPLRNQLEHSWQANPWNADGQDDGRPGNRNTNAWRNLNLTVAHLGAVTQLEVIDDAFDRPTIVSGGYQTSFHANHGIVRVRETVPSTMFRGVEIYTVRLLQDGVSFVDARARATHVPRLSLPNTANRGGWWGTDGNHDIRDNNTMPGTRVEEDVVTIMPTPRGEGEVYTGLRNFDMQFQLSIEAGFAQHYSEVLAEVTIFPHGVTEIVTLANVVDSITTSTVTPETIWRPTAAGFDHLSPTSLPDFTISEVDYGTFEVGDRIWLYLVGVHEATGRIVDHPNWPTNFYTSRNPIINDSGLRLSFQGIEQTVPGSGIYASVFIVTAPSNGTEAEVTFTGNFIDGFVSSGNDYRVVVGGSGIARNSYANVPANERESYEVGQYDLNPLFSGLTYAITVLEVRTAVETEGPGPGHGGDFITGGPVAELQLQAGMGSFFTNVGDDPQFVDVPFTFYNNAVTGDAMAMLNPRVFAHWINGDIDWDQATQTVTLTGIAADGTPTVVIMTVGSPVASINGVQTDIAAFAARYGHSTGPVGSVNALNIDGRTFVPLRFLTNAFGRNVSTVNWPIIEIS